MAETTTTRRAMLGAIAAAPAIAALSAKGAHAQPSAARARWEQMVAEYRRLRDAQRHDAYHGALQSAYDKHDARWASVADRRFLAGAQADAFDRSYDAQMAAEELHCERFSKPRWRAAEAVYATPSPDVPALLEKLEIAEEESDEDKLTEYLVAEIKHHLAAGRA